MTNPAALPPPIWQAALTLILRSAVIMGSPGPATVSATAVGAAYGFRRSLMYVGGLMLGTTVVLLAVAVGVVSVLLSIPFGASILLAVASVYILYLAFKIATAPPLARLHDAAPAPDLGAGFMLAIANPKAYLAIAAVFAGSTVVGGDHALDAAIKTALLGAMIVAIHLCWLFAGTSLSHVLQDPIRSRVVNVLLAAGLIAVTAVSVLG